MTVKNLEKKEGAVTFVMEIEKEQFEAAIDKAYRRSKNSINVPGFRRGKAPRKIIEGMYGATIFYEDAINDMFPDLYDEAIEAESLKVVGSPSITNVDYSHGPLELTVTADLYPEVTVGQYKGVEAVKPEASVSDDDVEQELSRLQQRNARISTVERPAADGDTVVIDFEGFVDGAAFDGGKAEGYSLKLGSGSFIPGFEDGCVGLSAGDEKDVEVTFPEDYGAENLAGKPAVFKVRVHEVKETILPELDDEFAKDVSEFDTLDEYRADLRAKQLASRQESADAEFKNNALTRAMDNMTAEIPNSMVEEELDKVAEQYAYQIQMSGMDVQQYFQMMGTDVNGFRASLRPIALDQVRSRLLLEKIVELEGIEVTDEELDAEFEKLAEEYVMDTDKVREYIDSDDLRRDLGYRKARDLIAETAVAAAPEKAEEAPAEETPAEEAPAEETPAEEAPKKKTARKTAARKTAEQAEEAPAEEGEAAPKKKPAARKTAKKQTEEAPAAAEAAPETAAETEPETAPEE